MPIQFRYHPFIASNLICYTEFVSGILDNSGHVDVEYLDFQKFRDKVNQSIELSPSLLNVLYSYSIRRKFCRNYISPLYDLASGIHRDSNIDRVPSVINY